MGQIIVRKIDLNTFRFSELDNNLIDEVKEFLAEEVDDEVSVYELPHHDDLPVCLKGMYVRYGINGQHYGTKETVCFALNLAYNWWNKKLKPVLLIGDLSAMEFDKTKGHLAHKTGTHIDVDLTNTLPRDVDYNLEAKSLCAILCMMMIALGAKRVLFNDVDVMAAVNRLAIAKRLNGRAYTHAAGHDNHFHVELPL